MVIQGQQFWYQSKARMRLENNSRFCILPRTVSKASPIIGQIFALDRWWNLHRLWKSASRN